MKNRIKIGTHLVSDKGIYTHHGICVDINNVIHYSGFAEGMQSGPVEIISLEEFLKTGNCSIKDHPNAIYNGKEASKRAKSRLNENLYSLTGNNCEHFVNWCIEGNHKSEQVDMGVSGFVPSGSTVTGVAATGVVANTGLVAGLSGSGIMSGLASVGSAVGGGAVAGIGVLAGAGGAGAAITLNKTVLADNEALDEEERESRAIGRKATVAGAATATAGGIGAVSAMGVTAGLSGAGITSGLAAIGGTVGGGMAAGTVIVTAAPVAAATAVGYGLYKLAKWIKN